MKPILIASAITLFSISVFAQRDPLDELDRWSRKQAENRTYKPGEETWAMVTNKMRADRPTLANTKIRGTVLTNTDIYKMKESGLGDETIVLAINSRPSAFDMSPQVMIAMKQAGYSETIISAMLNAEAGNKGNLIPLDKNGLPAEIGIYIQDTNKLTEIDAEPISWQAGGVAKKIWTRVLAGVAGGATSVINPALGYAVAGTIGYFGTTNGHVNAKIMNSNSKYTVEPNGEFIIRTPEGVAPSEYILVSLHEKDNRREFRFLTGGFIHSSSGAERNAMSFTYKKIAPRTYYVMLNNLRRGEYGFLPTNLVNNANAAFVGKLYSFSID